MQTKTFSQQNAVKNPECNGCDAKCKIGYSSEYYGYYPVIADKTVEKYTPTDKPSYTQISALCQTPQEALSLAARIVKLCDNYKHR